MKLVNYYFWEFICCFKAGIQLFVFDSTDIEYGTTIGKGGEGLVQCCTLKYNSLRIRAVVKTVLNNSDDSLNLTFDEIELLWWEILSLSPVIVWRQMLIFEFKFSF